MLKYFAALGLWAGNENSIEKLLTLIFDMNAETHKGVYCLCKSSFFLVRYLTEVFSSIRGMLDRETWKKYRKPLERLQAASNLPVHCVDSTPCF